MRSSGFLLVRHLIRIGGLGLINLGRHLNLIPVVLIVIPSNGGQQKRDEQRAEASHVDLQIIAAMESSVLGMMISENAPAMNIIRQKPVLARPCHNRGSGSSSSHGRRGRGEHLIHRDGRVLREEDNAARQRRERRNQIQNQIVQIDTEGEEERHCRPLKRNEKTFRQAADQFLKEYELAIEGHSSKLWTEDTERSQALDREILLELFSA